VFVRPGFNYLFNKFLYLIINLRSSERSVWLLQSERRLTHFIVFPILIPRRYKTDVKNTITITSQYTQNNNRICYARDTIVSGELISNTTLCFKMEYSAYNHARIQYNLFCTGCSIAEYEQSNMYANFLERFAHCTLCAIYRQGGDICWPRLSTKDCDSI